MVTSTSICFLRCVMLSSESSRKERLEAWVRQCAPAQVRPPACRTGRRWPSTFSASGSAGKPKDWALSSIRALPEPTLQLQSEFREDFPAVSVAACPTAASSCVIRASSIDALKASISLTTLREHEFAFFSSDAFPRVLADHGVVLARPTGENRARCLDNTRRWLREDAMTPQERQLVDELFDRLARLENAPRDGEAERAISEGLARAPHAIYPLVQTVLVQDEALRRADARIRELTGEDPALAADGRFSRQHASGR